MATARDMGIADVGFLADEDLTDKQYTVVKAASTVNQVACANSASAGFLALGVLQNSPSLGQEARVRMLGLTKVYGEMNGTCQLVWGGFVKVASTGRGEPAEGTGVMPVAGRWLSATVTSGDVIGEVFWFGMSACTAAAC